MTPKPKTLSERCEDAVRYQIDWLNTSVRKIPVEYIITEHGCHEIISHCRNKYGYVKLAVGGNKVQLAHRLVWVHHNGSIPNKYCVCHHCDNPACVNLEHLFLGTHDDNMADMVRKGRSSPSNGTNNPNAKLTPNQVLQIRKLAKNFSQVKVAKIFGISQSHVYSIKAGIRWKDLKPQKEAPKDG